MKAFYLVSKIDNTYVAGPYGNLDRARFQARAGVRNDLGQLLYSADLDVAMIVVPAEQVQMFSASPY